MTDLTDPIFHDEEAARAHLEAVRWANGVFCPHCGSFDCHRLETGTHRAGLFYCRDCRGQFSVTVGTVFERSHVPLHKWVLANYQRWLGLSEQRFASDRWLPCRLLT